jgi:hypothetical protein
MLVCMHACTHACVHVEADVIVCFMRASQDVVCDVGSVGRCLGMLSSLHIELNRLVLLWHVERNDSCAVEVIYVLNIV